MSMCPFADPRTRWDAKHSHSAFPFAPYSVFLFLCFSRSESRAHSVALASPQFMLILRLILPSVGITSLHKPPTKPLCVLFCFVLLLLFSFPILEVRAQTSCSLPSVNCRPQDNGITWDTKLQPVIPFASLQKVFGTCGLIFQQCEDSLSPVLLFDHSSD